ncbi:hypothetical protein D769_17669, partial [Cupriavidus sp. HMR-1]
MVSLDEKAPRRGLARYLAPGRASSFLAAPQSGYRKSGQKALQSPLSEALVAVLAEIAGRFNWLSAASADSSTPAAATDVAASAVPAALAAVFLTGRAGAGRRFAPDGR